MGHENAVSHLEKFANHSPWHVCFALGLQWGGLAKDDLIFTAAAVGLMEQWNDADLNIARQCHLERGRAPLEQSLKGGHLLFSIVKLPSEFPSTLQRLHDVQQRWLSPIISPKRPKYIGSWNATAMFMSALFANLDLAAQLKTPEVHLPPNGPVLTALGLLARVAVLSRKPSGSELDDGGFEPGALYENNELFAELRRGRDDWSLLDVHGGLYMLGTRWAPPAEWS